ncbi:MAG: hypothetical protein IPJ19_17410 [Planctomycetes bacterium]|nr:hypothetical protein [Planctomycetota bacterium]
MADASTTNAAGNLRKGALVLASFAACLGFAAWCSRAAPNPWISAMGVVLWACACALVLCLSRWLRQRTSAVDALQPVLLLALPALLDPGKRLLLLTAAASAALVLASTGFAALRERLLGADARGQRVLGQRTLGIALIVLVVWLRHIELPLMVQDDGLDRSWSMALGSFLLEGRQAGTDWIFTAGPLSGLGSGAYQPELYWLKLALWEGIWRLASTLCLVLAASRIEGVLERAACIVFLIVPSLYMDSFALATLLAAALLIDARPARGGALLESIALLAIGGLALAKFTLLVASVGILGALAISRGLRLGRGAGLRLAGVELGVLAALWFLAGQGLANILPYLRSSWEIASVYSEAQSSSALATSWRPIALTTLALCTVAVLAWSRSAARPRGRSALALGFLFLFFCAWKTGFVRAADHVPFFFAFAAPAALLLPAPQVGPWLLRSGFSGLRLCAFLLACVGLVRSDPSQRGALVLFDDVHQGCYQGYAGLEALLDPAQLEARLEAELESQRASLRLPAVQQRVGQASIDLLGFRQGLLMLQRMNWTPRPAFQGYITFTPWIQRRNAEFLAAPRAPRYLLARIESIDGRWPMADDAQAHEVVCRDYAPVLSEGRYVLLERRAQPRPEPACELVVERELRFGERLVLPPAQAGCARVLTLEIGYTLLGRLARLLDSTPQIDMRLRDAAGLERSGRIVPATMRSRVLIDPVIREPEEWAQWIVGEALPRCESLVVDIPASQAWRFHAQFHARIEALRGLQPEPTPGVHAGDWMDEVFHPQPTSRVMQANPVNVQVEGREAALVQSPSRLIWNLAPGHYRLSGWFGMLPEVWEQARVDGADFLVILRSGTDSKRLLARSFRPEQTLTEHAMQALDLEFTQAQAGELILVTTPGPGENRACDWCYWAGVKLERMDEPAKVKKE